MTDRPEFESLAAATILRDGKNVLQLLIPTDAGLVKRPRTQLRNSSRSTHRIAIEVSVLSAERRPSDSDQRRQVGSPIEFRMSGGSGRRSDRTGRKSDRTVVPAQSQIEMVAPRSVPSPFVRPGDVTRTADQSIEFRSRPSYFERLGVAFKSMRVLLALTLEWELAAGLSAAGKSVFRVGRLALARHRWNFRWLVGLPIVR